MKTGSEIEQTLIQTMAGKIEAMDRLTRELMELGQEIPAVEKNARCILSFIHVLKFGISDVAKGMGKQ